MLNVMKRITNLHKNAETLWSCSCPFPVITQSKRFINRSTRGISEHVICVQHHYTSVQNPNRSWKTTHQLKISLPLWTYQSSLETNNLTAARTLVIKLSEGLSTHLQGLVLQPLNWDTRRPRQHSWAWSMQTLTRTHILVRLVWREALEEVSVSAVKHSGFCLAQYVPYWILNTI